MKKLKIKHMKLGLLLEFVNMAVSQRKGVETNDSSYDY